ncbi:MAG: hypothetical protein E7773_09625 [Sphingomonas sp.]|uniref:hypothetical protein n=1 Tax=Sphingomonas sp. TaxID=28214 RepID=UPI00121C48E8|nr:hypothetical protein [Sphingomonas sp.]THD36171.1 MAG: hypothetical protein E7773_09625 [Sphingomonas sp.]
MLAFLAAAAPAAFVSRSMTLAEARKLSPQQLAQRLLGEAGASREYVEASISGNGGIMIGAPGLNSIDLYERPKSAGFAGLCQVEGVHIEFSTSRYDTPGDPPHRVTDFWKMTRFAMLQPTDTRIDDGGDEQQERKCAALGPVADRTDPVFFFVVQSDKAVDAYFAMRALAKAQIAAPALRDAIKCKSYDPKWPVCANPAGAIREIPVRRMAGIRVERCADNVAWCVSATWAKSREGNETEEVGLTIHTDASRVDPPADFNVTAVDLEAGTSVDD